MSELLGLTAPALSPTVTIEDAEDINTGYVPRPLQYELHRRLRRFNVLVAHRRFGKTVFSINHMGDRALKENKPMPRFAYLAPTYGQAKRVVWDYLKAWASKIPNAEVNEAELRVDLPHNKARIILLSAENPTSLKGIYLDGVILDEYAEMNPVAWREVIRPTLSDRKGWAIFIGTPKGRNNFYEMYKGATEGWKETASGILVPDADWYGQVFRASETGILDEKELASARQQMTEEEYNQEFECSWDAGLVGSYFTKELALARAEGRITTVSHDPMVPVDTYWDLGLNDATSVWFCQTIRGEDRMIDYYEISGASLPEIVVDLQKKRYKYGETVLPHDAAARDLSTGRSQVQVMRSLGLSRIRVIPRVGTKREGINAARMAFSTTWFDKQKCDKGLEALANYQRKWDAKNNVYQESPLHNWASNGADAFQQFGLGRRGDSRDSGRSRGDYGGSRPYEANTQYDLFRRQR
jgi:phage terminase large subunit